MSRVFLTELQSSSGSTQPVPIEYIFRKNEIKSLEERQQKDNQNRITDIAKLDGKLDSENNARKDCVAYGVAH